jgi:hypothetical protein
VNRTNNIWCHWKNWRGSSSGFEYPMLTNKDWQTTISRTQMYRVWVMVFNFNHISVMWWRSVLYVDETWSSAHKQTNKQAHKQQQKHWNKMISNNYLTVGADQNLYNKNIVLPISVVTTFLFDFYCFCYLFMFNRSLVFWVVFCRFLFVHLPFLFYFGHCIVCHLRFLVTPLITLFCNMCMYDCISF